MKRKPAHFANRYWRRVEGGALCDYCHRMTIGWLQAYLHKETYAIVCPDCYEAGIRIQDIRSHK